MYKTPVALLNHEDEDEDEEDEMDEVEKHQVKYFADTKVLLLKGVIDDKMVSGVFDLAMVREDPIKYLVLCTPGGAVDSGFAIGDILSGFDITTVSFGSVYSMGVYLYALGKKRLCFPNTSFLIHAGSISFQEVPYHKASAVYDYWNKEQIDRILSTICKGKSGARIAKEVKAGKEYYLGAKESKEVGLTHSIVTFKEFKDIICHQ